VQRHLAELLGAAELKQQSAISHLGAARKAVLRFRNVVFAAGCSGRLTADWRTDDAESIAELPNGWKRITLGEIALTVTKGTTPTSYGHSFTDSGIGFIKVENLRDGRIDRESIRSFIAEATHQAQARSILQEGDILFSIAGTIGRTAIVHRDDLPANTNQALAIIRGTSRVVIPEYLVIALQGALRAVAADAARAPAAERRVGADAAAAVDVDGAGAQASHPEVLSTASSRQWHGGEVPPCWLRTSTSTALLT